MFVYLFFVSRVNKELIFYLDNKKIKYVWLNFE